MNNILTKFNKYVFNKYLFVKNKFNKKNNIHLKKF